MSEHVSADDLKRIKSIMESLLVVASEAITVDEIQETLEEGFRLTHQDIAALLEELKIEYVQNQRGYQITEIGGKYQLCTESQNADWVKKFLQVKHAEGLSKPALESLAIIAYRQPITKVEIEGIRGVNVDGVLKKLIEKGLVRTQGKKDIMGHPFLYVTTERFLDYFGLKSLDDLPQREELRHVTSHKVSHELKEVAQQN
ncbi:MAG: SMC-Scp complex subunit ScpB [Chlamydiae bacterium]|nr:SMC-Scp complex subunit ScpB [Chlamydiota bacterium]MBI3265977.1 SMC-Scp complex subunit ScpB [Chlamydiota bacterium]